MSRTIVVVPCYNESRRLQPNRFLALLDAVPGVELLFVDDGSSDGTWMQLVALQSAHPQRLHVYKLPDNRGKAEAVRQGVLRAYELHADYVGYWDADLATPLDEIPLFRGLLEQRDDLTLVMGSRICLLGRRIERTYWRHVLGRAFATLASAVLGVPVYDTQCGAKLFRATSAMRSVFERPFHSRWIFDVEILARMTELAGAARLPHPRDTVAECPLQTWTDVAGSKLRPAHFVRAAVELAAIYWRHRGHRVPASEAALPANEDQQRRAA